ncbi:MAG TPA: nucleotidyltransferase domain-containing protein [bacterium]|nr:nucleotidyltransferase domain-containing protein [bacterium]
MANWTKEKMLEELQAILGTKLVSVVLFGSAAAGDHAGKSSDINLLVVTHPLDYKELQGLSKAVVPWTRQGNPPPLLLTQEHLTEFTDVFPVEILDIQHNHRVLSGPDPVTDLKVSHDHLRVELEHELQGKLLQLRMNSTMTEARPGLVEKLMIDSFSTFLVLFKAALWLYGVTPPVKKMDALRKLREKVTFDIDVFETVDRLKRGEKMKDLDVLGTFEKYLGNIETIVDNVNQ